jgi:hypothetical protein
MATSPNTSGSLWVRNAYYDISLIMGGAIFTLVMAAVAIASPSLLPIFFWTWLVGFEGSHFWATFSRTYFDRKFSTENSRVLAGSLVFFVIPLLAVMTKIFYQDSFFMDLYGLFIFVWSLYHNVRQHYGFLKIYIKKSGQEESVALSYQKLIYFAVCGAQVFFLFHLKGPLAFSKFPAFETLGGIWKSLLTYGPYLISTIALVWLLVLGTKSFSSKGRKGLLPAAYVGVCLLFYSVMFYVIAPGEPFFSQHSNNAQMLMLVTIMNSLFHNIQYHAIVWHYSESRYVKGPSDRFGWAANINKSVSRYIMAALLLGSVFGMIVWNMGDWPSITGAQPVGSGSWGLLAYVLYFGIVGHHFYLDQKIWRPSVQKDLGEYLGLAQQAG